MLNLRVSILLSCLLGAMASLSASAEMPSSASEQKISLDTVKIPNPYSHNYVHTLLKDLREESSPVKTFYSSPALFLPGGVLMALSRPFVITTQSGFSGAVNLVSHILMLQVGLSNVSSAHLVSPLIKSEDVRGNLLLGNLYNSPLYLRIGWDYMPFGYHFSEVIDSQYTCPQSIVNPKCVIIQGGSTYSPSANVALEYSAALLVANGHDLFVGNLHSAIKQPFINLPIIKNLVVGIGVGTSLEIYCKPLFNVYNHISFSKSRRLKWEYTYNPLVRTVSSSYMPNRPSHAFHGEFTQHVAPITKWNIPSALIVGYAHSTQGFVYDNLLLRVKNDDLLLRGLFIAGKLSLWKQHITVVAGANWDKQLMPEPLGKIELSL